MTNEQLCTAAIQATGARGLGDPPAAEEMTEALRVLQAMLEEALITGRTFTDVLVSTSYTAGEDERLFSEDATNVPITLPETITDASTGEPRPPRNGAVVQIAGADSYVYVARKGGWQAISGQALASAQPLGAEFDQALVNMLAVRLAANVYRKPIDPAVMAQAGEGRRQIRRSFRQFFQPTVDPVLVGTRTRMGYL